MLAQYVDDFSAVRYHQFLADFDSVHLGLGPLADPPQLLLVQPEKLHILTHKLHTLYVNRFFMKLFKTSDIKIVEICREQFDFASPSVQLDRR